MDIILKISPELQDILERLPPEKRAMALLWTYEVQNSIRKAIGRVRDHAPAPDHRQKA